MKFLTAVLMSFLLSACATSRCKSIDKEGKVRDPSNPSPEELAQKAAEENPAPVTPMNSATTSPEVIAPIPTQNVDQGEKPKEQADAQPPVTVKVYKYDSSRQCGQGKTIALEVMAKQLKNIKILSQEKKNDGMMRIQMCGAPSGVANVYEIDQKDLKKAIKIGFREWKYSNQ